MYVHTNNSKAIRSSSHERLKFVAYCAIVLSLSGCASTTSQLASAISEDALSNDKVVERAKSIKTLKQAQAQENKAIEVQNLADANLMIDKVACNKIFLVNRCINKVTAVRNDLWDTAQLDRTSARYFIRQYEANERRVALEQKIAAYRREQAAQAATRLANKAAYEAKLKAYAEKLAQPDLLTPEERKKNVTLFEAKRNTILEIQRKRAEAAQARADAAEKAAKSAAAAVASPQ